MADQIAQEANTPPDGFILVASGVAEEGDWFFNNEQKVWMPIYKFSIGDAAEDFWGLARPAVAGVGDHRVS